MNGSADITSHTHPTAEDRGFLALFIVQLVGTVLAFGTTISLKEDATSSFPWIKLIQLVIILVFVLTLVVAAFQRDLAPMFWRAFGGAPLEPRFLYRLDLHSAHLIYFLVDFAALAFMIYATGGSIESLYSTFLFIIVPISIALGNPGKRTIVIFASITVCIFIVLLWYPTPPAPVHLAGTTTIHKIWFGVITAVCVFLPTFVFCIQHRDSRQMANEKARELSHVATRGDTDTPGHGPG